MFFYFSSVAGEKKTTTGFQSVAAENGVVKMDQNEKFGTKAQVIRSTVIQARS